MLSFAYSLISLAFQINFTGGNPVQSDTAVVVTSGDYNNSPAYGMGSFPVYWMLNFFGMIALGLACENVAMIVGQPWTGCWLIFWVSQVKNDGSSLIHAECDCYCLHAANPSFRRAGFPETLERLRGRHFFFLPS